MDEEEKWNGEVAGRPMAARSRRPSSLPRWTCTVRSLSPKRRRLPRRSLPGPREEGVGNDDDEGEHEDDVDDAAL